MTVVARASGLVGMSIMPHAQRTLRKMGITPAMVMDHMHERVVIHLGHDNYPGWSIRIPWEELSPPAKLVKFSLYPIPTVAADIGRSSIVFGVLVSDQHLHFCQCDGDEEEDTVPLATMHEEWVCHICFSWNDGHYPFCHKCESYRDDWS